MLQQKKAEGLLHLAFIGMSNVGKSFRARELVKEGFDRCSVDKEICKHLGVHNIEALSKWMGYPHEDLFVARQQEYLDLEQLFTEGTSFSPGKNGVLDTTGSVVYLPASTRQYLQEHFLVVYLTMPDHRKKAAVDRYFAHPKPVVWGDHFEQRAGESEQQALRRCYPELLRWRETQYEAIADVTLDLFDGDQWVDLPTFWERLETALEN